ncbi:MAG: 1-acyl-sn-glycerol-3-phosphate acyltransferase [Cyclobacteriaceae bacterium]
MRIPIILKSRIPYLITKACSWVFVQFFFGGVVVIDRKKIPKDAAVIFAPNHQGAFIDAVLLGSHVNLPVHFLTRADIFKKGWVKAILHSLHMIAIYRIRDGIRSLSQNDAVFEACFEILNQSRSILIFPEGNHGDEFHLRPISKGSGRLALDAKAALGDKKLYVVPVGLNYFSHRRPYARMLIKFGDPIDANNYMNLYQDHKQKAYNAFKADLEVGMKKTLILAEYDENYEKKKQFIFQPKHEKLSFDELKALGDENYYEEVKPRKLNVAQKFLVGFFSLFNIVPLFALSKLLPVFKDPVFKVSIKYLAGTFFHILWWSLILALGWIFIGWKAAVFFVVCAIMFLYARQSIIKF